jgi:type IV secretory pathway ATPase VirB11/archaellum biosynthesis ATPase
MANGAEGEQARKRLAEGIAVAVKRAYEGNVSALARAAGVPIFRVHGYKEGVARLRAQEVEALERVIRQALTSDVLADTVRDGAAPGKLQSVERALCQEIDQIEEMLEPDVKTICIDNPGYYWVQRNAWKRVAWPELTDKRLERLADLAWTICHGDMSTSRGVARGSFPDPATGGGGAHIKLDVIRRPVIIDGIAKLALRLPFREELSLKGIFEGTKHATARPGLDDLKEGDSLKTGLQEAIAKRQMILVNGAGIAERFEFIDILVNSIPEGRRVVVLDGDNGWSVRDDVLPENSVRLHYSKKSGGVTIKDVARAAEALRPDHLIVPDAEDMERDEFLLYVGYVFPGQIVGVHIPFQASSKFHELAEVVVSIINSRVAPPLGINGVLVRQQG